MKTIRYNKLVSDRIPQIIEAFDNAYHLWISRFYSYLNETDCAGFVMTLSAAVASFSYIR